MIPTKYFFQKEAPTAIYMNWEIKDMGTFAKNEQDL